MEVRGVISFTMRNVHLLPSALVAFALALGVSAPGALSASPAAPIKLSGLPTFLPGGIYSAFEKPFVEARVTNTSSRTIRRKDGLLRLYLTRKADLTPAGRPVAEGGFSADAKPGRSVFATSDLVFPKGASGRYRLTFCVDIPRHRMRCAVAKGALTVRPAG